MILQGKERRRGGQGGDMILQGKEEEGGGGGVYCVYNNMCPPSYVCDGPQKKTEDQ